MRGVEIASPKEGSIAAIGGKKGGKIDEALSGDSGGGGGGACPLPREEDQIGNKDTRGNIGKGWFIFTLGSHREIGVEAREDAFWGSFLS